MDTGADVRVLVPTASNPSSPGTGWTAVGFEDSGWTAGTTGVGYDRPGTYDPEISLDVAGDMDGVNAGIYMRIEFEVSDPGAIDVLNLKMKYDDGFIAYLNGQEIARRGVNGSGKDARDIVSHDADKEETIVIEKSLNRFLKEAAIVGPQKQM